MKRQNTLKKINRTVPFVQKIFGKKYCIIWVMFLLFAFQLVNLSGDPSPLKRFGDVGDEGYWVHNARSKILFDEILPDELNQAYIGSPLFTVAEYYSFKIFGVHYFSARIISLISFWAIICLVYYVIKISFTWRLAILSVLMIGFMHEALMYAKWGTPIFMEMMFLLLTILCIEVGARKNKRYVFFLAGISYSLALMSKISAIYFIVSLALILLGELYIRRRINYKHLLIFGLGSITILLPVYYFFYHPNAHEVMFFMNTIGQMNGIAFSLASITTSVKHNFPNILISDFFIYPSIVVLVFLSLLLIIDVCIKIIKKGFTVTLKELAAIEYYSICWLVGGIAMLMVTSEPSDRRFIMFIVPLIILSISYISNNTYRLTSLPHNTRVDSRLSTLLCIFAGSIFSFYLIRSINALYLNWLKFIPSNLYLSSWKIVTILFAFIIAYTLIVSNNKRIALYVLLIYYFSINMVMNLIWYSTDTHSLLNASQDINDISTENKQLLTGWLSHYIALENTTLPIWYLKSKNNDSAINDKYRTLFDKNKFILIDGIVFNAELAPHIEPTYLVKSDFVDNNSHFVKQIKISRLPFTNKYRFIGDIFLIN